MKPEEAINFFSEDIPFSAPNQADLQLWLGEVITQESHQIGPLSIILCSDAYLHKMNVEYLQHDEYTDVITFDYSEGTTCSGDVFISLERVEENASKNNASQQDELKRVMVHGLLHLLGYKDKDPEDKRIMKAKEDYYLSLQAI